MFGCRTSRVDKCLDEATLEELKNEIDNREDFDVMKVSVRSHNGETIIFTTKKSDLELTRSQIARIFKRGIASVDAVFE